MKSRSTNRLLRLITAVHSASSICSIGLTAATLAPVPAIASCGTSFCTLMTDRYALSATESPLGWSADIRMESVDQSRLRSGTRTLDPKQVTGEEAVERRTRNLNLMAGFSYGLNDDWSFTARVPLVRRDHLHDLLDDNTGQPSMPEQWRFTRLGDVQALARRQFRDEGSPTSYAVIGGLKLPTGSVDVSNASGIRAERALQPGTGTTDVILGLAWRTALGLADALIGQVNVSRALNAYQQFKPGQRIELSVGWSHAYTPTFGALVQLNARQRSRDSGLQAEPENSGSNLVDLSPGLTWGAGENATLYAYVQLPVYQRVNGIQLVPRSALAVGWTIDF